MKHGTSNTHTNFKGTVGKATGRNDVSLGDEEEVDEEAGEKIGKGTGKQTGGSGRDAPRTRAEEHESGNGRPGEYGMHRSHAEHPHNHEGAELSKIASKERPKAPVGDEHLGDSKHFG